MTLAQPPLSPTATRAHDAGGPRGGARTSLRAACRWIIMDVRAIEQDLDHVAGTEETMRRLSLHRVNLRQSLVGLERALKGEEGK